MHRHFKEKRRLRQQYSQAHDPLVKTSINQLQKEIKDNLMIESQASWKNFLKPKGQRDYRVLWLGAKTTK